MSKIQVHTLGDSTLDNCYWLLNGSNAATVKDDTVEGLLAKKLGSDYELVSHAYDGFTTTSVLEGGDVGRVLSINPHQNHSTRARAYLDNRKINPLSERFFAHPLNDLKAAVAKDPESIHYVVISVGGNDFRERLLNPIALLTDIGQIQERYLRIIKEVKDLKSKNRR